MSTEEKIILATINCIEKYGLENTTIRQIGKEAGVNSASISYYFRSKDVLMEKVMELILKNAFDLGNFDSSKGLSPKDRLVFIMDGMIKGALQYPNITKSFFLDLLNNNNHETLMVKKCNDFIIKLESELIINYPMLTEISLRMILMQISSATFLFLGLFPNFFISYQEIDLADEKIRRAYVESLINKLL